MFERTLEIGSLNPPAAHRWILSTSTGLHLAAVGGLVLASYLIVEKVHDPVSLIPVTYMDVAPPPSSPPPAPPAGGAAARVVAADDANSKAEPQLPPEIFPEPQPPLVQTTVPVDFDEPLGGVGDGTGLEGAGSGDGPPGVPGGSDDGVEDGVLDGTSDGDGPVVPGPDVVLPVLLHKVSPIYPDLARAARIQGRVICQAVIDREGNVTKVTVLQAADPLLVEPSITAIRQWKYAPAHRGGRPLPVYLTVQVEFILR